MVYIGPVCKSIYDFCCSLLQCFWILSLSFSLSLHTMSSIIFQIYTTQLPVVTCWLLIQSNRERITNTHRMSFPGSVNEYLASEDHFHISWNNNNNEKHKLIVKRFNVVSDMIINHHDYDGGVIRLWWN